jgi:hypothetical protein
MHPLFETQDLWLNFFGAYIWFILLMGYLKFSFITITKNFLDSMVDIYAVTHLVAVPLLYDTSVEKVCDPDVIQPEKECIKMTSDIFNNINCNSRVVGFSLATIAFTSGVMVIFLYTLRNKKYDVNWIIFSLIVSPCFVILVCWNVVLYEAVNDSYPCKYITGIKNMSLFGIITSYFVLSFLISHKIRNLVLAPNNELIVNEQ